MKNRKFMNLIDEVQRREHDFMHLSVSDRETKKNALAALTLPPLKGWDSLYDSPHHIGVPWET